MKRENNNKKQIKLIVNPDYLATLKLISGLYNFESFNEFIAHVLSGKALLVHTVTKSKSSIDHHTSTCITQGGHNFLKIQDMALSGKSPLVTNEFEKCRSILKASHTSETAPAFFIVLDQMRKAIDRAKELSVVAAVDETPTLLDLKKTLSDTDIHAVQPRTKQNVSLFLDEKIYDRFFAVSVKGNPANRRSFKNAIESNLSFFKHIARTDTIVFIESLISNLNDFLHAMNSKQLQGDYTGSYELLKIVVNTKTQLKKKITEMEGENYGNR